MKRVFFVSLFLSLSLSEEQTKGAKRTKILSRIKKKTLLFAERAVVSLVCSFSFFTTFHTKSMKKKAERFLVYPIALTREVFIYLIESHTFSSPSLARLLSEARVDRSENTHAHSYTHTHRASSYHGASDALAHPDELLSGFGRGE